MATKNKFMNAMKMPAIADMFSSEADRQRESGDLVTEVPLSELHPFVNHPFKVRDDEDMLSDCGYIKLLNQAPDDANDIARLLHISDEEKRYIENAEVGSGLLIADKVVVPFNNTFPQDTELFRLMDTNPNSSKQKAPIKSL